MILYAYWCAVGEHEVTQKFTMGEAKEEWYCPLHRHWCLRDFGTHDKPTISIHPSNDEFRSAWLSSKPQGNIFEASPKDKHEAEVMGKALGRIYVGNDPAKHGMRMSPAIEKKLYG